ncbi:hypothetical protein ANO11243_042050 [Dothideomycetidae sp. 11243]|nr:hypothetical protein ANO11243_042050 [fungal sp. No.11243]
MHFSFALQCATLGLWATTSASTVPQPPSYMTRAHKAVTKLQTFYNTPTSGWWSEGWWNTAQCLTLLADLRSVDDSDFIKSITDGPNGVFTHTLQGQHMDNGYLAYDGYFDDELWWVIALIQVYDVTGQKKFLEVARLSFERVVRDDQPTQCGGLWNAYDGQPDRVDSTIATSLFVKAGALLAARIPSMKDHFLSPALTQLAWIEQHLLINGIIAGDELSPYPSCSNDMAYLTYIEGTMIGAYVALWQVTGEADYMSKAESIASQTLSENFDTLVVNGIITEFCDHDNSCNADIAQFKGILARGLRILHAANPNALNGSIPAFLQKNADSIWGKSKGKNGLLGMNWSGPFVLVSNAGSAEENRKVRISSHSSATMALVAAAIV